MEAHSLIFQWTVKKRYGPGNATTDNALVGLMWMKRLYFFVLFLKRSKHLLGRNSVSQTSHYVAQVRHGTTARIRFCMFDFSCSTATTKWLLQQIILLAPQSLLKGVWHWLWFSVPRMTAAKMTRRRRATTAPIPCGGIHCWTYLRVSQCLRMLTGRGQNLFFSKRLLGMRQPELSSFFWN